MTDRKTFLRLLAALTSFRSIARPAPQQASGPAATREPFSIRVVEDCAAALRCSLFMVGDRLGLFQLMAQSGPVTADELARRSKLNGRILRDWLNAMSSAHYVEYDPAGRTYSLDKEHASVLADEEGSDLFLGGLFQFAGSLASAGPALTKALRTGVPLQMSDYPAEFSRAIERVSAPLFRHQLAQKWIPLMPRVHEKLTNGGFAVDLACGTGLASIMLAKAFPKSRFVGYDPYEPAIQIGRSRAEKEGVSGRVEFVAAGSAKLPRGRFDLVTIFGSAHHFSDPIAELTKCREALVGGGSCLVQDGNLSLNPTDNANPVGRLAYASSALYCVHDSLAKNGPGFGAEFNEEILSTLAAKSGFSSCRVIWGARGGSALYELRA